jgi:hypothetical protein
VLDGVDVKVPNSVHLARPWVINEIAHDFRLLDVWALPVEGGPDEFSTFVEGVVSFDPTDLDSALARVLFAVRLRLGDLLGWDDSSVPRPIPGCTETSLSERLPDELRGSADGPEPGVVLAQAGFSPLYRTDDEWAAEVSNATVHGVVHFAWVEAGDARHRAQMAIYAKPRGLVGEAYMRLIEPFRQLVVYPALMRQIGRAWGERPVI